jgi:hypothetical protein
VGPTTVAFSCKLQGDRRRLQVSNTMGHGRSTQQNWPPIGRRVLYPTNVGSSGPQSARYDPAAAGYWAEDGVDADN